MVLWLLLEQELFSPWAGILLKPLLPFYSISYEQDIIYPTVNSFYLGGLKMPQSQSFLIWRLKSDILSHVDVENLLYGNKSEKEVIG